MTNFAVRAIGGLLSGAGDAMVSAAKQKREDALAAIVRAQTLSDRADDRAFLTKRDDTQHGYSQADIAAQGDLRLKELGITEAGADRRLDTTERGANARNAVSEGGANTRAAAALAASQGEIDHYITLSDGTPVGVTKTGKVITLTGPGGKPLKTEAGPGPKDKILLDILKARHTGFDDLGEKTIDWAGIDTDLRKSGRGALADQITGISSAPGGAPAGALGPDGLPATASPAPSTSRMPPPEKRIVGQTTTVKDGVTYVWTQWGNKTGWTPK